MTTILVADDEPEMRNYLQIAVGGAGYRVELAENGNEVLERVRRPDPEVGLILLDIFMPQRSGLDTLKVLRQDCPDIPVIVLSGASSPANIVSAMRDGAVDYLAKPVGRQDLLAAIQKVLPERASITRTSSNESSKGAWNEKLELLLDRIGDSEVPVLLQGETGVGKEVLARMIHARSPRASGPFLKLNCAALPSELVESELFGYERGAFTGAFKSTTGRFEMAQGGTILLDEIGDMDFKLQAKLLQVLQDQEFHRLGARETTKVDVRIMAATHCDLEQAIVDGRFREDLYFRLNIIDIQVPPLRERRDEILPLAEHFVRLHGRPNRTPAVIPDALRTALLEHRWPGNVRELENVIRKFLVLGDAELVASELSRQADSRFAARRGPEAPSVAPASLVDAPRKREQISAVRTRANGSTRSDSSSTLDQVADAHKQAETDAILKALDAALWNRKQAAAILKVDYKALLYRMKKLGIGERGIGAGSEGAERVV